MVAPKVVNKDKGNTGIGKDQKKGESKEQKEPKFPSNIVFAAPPETAWIPREVIKRGPQAIDLRQLIRMKPLIRGRGDFGIPMIDYDLVRSPISVSLRRLGSTISG